MSTFLAWLQRERSSTRLAFLLQAFSRCATAVLALVWTRLILYAMGDELNGLWLTFLAAVSLGAGSDFGLGAAVGIRAGRYLGQGDRPSLMTFLANARALFLLVGFVLASLALAFSPVLPQWLEWSPAAGAGSLSALCAIGAAGIFAACLSSYVSNLNYACGNVVWPIIPTFLLAQGSLAAHWILARAHAPLWMQYLPYLVALLIATGLAWSFLRFSHGTLAALLPLRVNFPAWRELFGQSIWMYFWSAGALVYTAADRFFLMNGFGAALIPKYHNNYKVCELALFVTVAASFVALPKFTAWFASNDTGLRTRAIAEARRLQQFQVVLTCASALAYLALNDWFMRLWLGADYTVPLEWQFAFALSLVVTGCGDTAIQLAPRCSARGMRVAGVAIALTALLNVLLSYAAMRAGSILGIAAATVVAQSFFSFFIARFVCRELTIDFPRWFLKAWIWPVILVSLGYAARKVLPLQTPVTLAIFGGVLLLLFAGTLKVMNVSRDWLRNEWASARGMFRSGESKAA